MKKSLSFIAIISLCAFAGAQGSPASAQPQAKAAENTASQFGKSFAEAMAGVSSYARQEADYTSELGVAATVEFSFNIYKDESDTYGLNISVPLEYYWMRDHTSGIRADHNNFYFPVFARPYYRFRVSEDFEVTPFASAGVGGVYEHSDWQGDGNSDSLDFLWSVGGGVEFLFFRDFALTPKYEFSRTESNPAYDEHILSVQFAWKFAEKTAFVAQYQHIFLENSRVCEDIGKIGVRFEF